MTKTCKIEDCEREHWSRGWCLMHYKHWWRHGDATVRKCAPNGSRKKHPLYRTYCMMIARCCSETNHAYQEYGGRGIKVCDRWLGVQGFDVFVKDMGEKPKGHSLDRINNGNGYSPNNCKWSTPKEQANNRRERRWYRRPILEGGIS